MALLRKGLRLSTIIASCVAQACEPGPQEEVAHPTARNIPGAAVAIRPDRLPASLASTRDTTTWLQLAQALAGAAAVFDLGNLDGDGPAVFGSIVDVELDERGHTYVAPTSWTPPPATVRSSAPKSRGSSRQPRRTTWWRGRRRSPGCRFDDSQIDGGWGEAFPRERPQTNSRSCVPWVRLLRYRLQRIGLRQRADEDHDVRALVSGAWDEKATAP